jgi:ADP-ribose pyrophosphatase
MSSESKKKEIAYQGPVFSVVRMQVDLPDGRTRTYDRVDIQDAVTVLPIDADGSVYFVRQYRVGSESSLLELPAGKIEEGESAQTTAEREIREEIGMAAASVLPMGGFYISPGYSTEYMHCFLATGLSHAPLAPDSDEFINVEKIPLEQVKKMITAGELPDSKTLAIIMLAWDRLPPGQPKY